nr:glycoside hydrolase 43 family protein [uncultured Bacteroides sp.]
MVGQTKKSYSTTYINPIINADVPDLSVTRSGSDFYLISTTMHLMPGAPIMKSKDLVHWEIVNYVFDKLTDNSKYDLVDGTVYGRGQWASSIRYHKGKFYVLFSPNDDPFRAYIYSTTNPAGKWTLVSRTQHFHDASLFFDDDDRIYVFSGTGSLKELKSDFSDVKPDGVNMKIFERDKEETGLLEGSQVIKHNGKYYLLMISWPKNGKRRQVCYRADKITGPYEKKVILEDNFNGFPYAGQGCIIDDEKGNWYGLVFQDRGGIGRVPLLMPCRWVDGWPMLGDETGHVPLTGQVPLKTFDTGKKFVESDDFNNTKLKINWQWNHNPINDFWSLTERPGFLRLKTSRVVNNLYAAPNTITQRMEGPKCSGVVTLDVSKMKDGDVAGFSAFNGNSALLSVVMDGNKKYLTMSTNVADLDGASKAINGVQVEEKARVELSENIIYLCIDCDFNLNKDIATFSYSLDNINWIPIGREFKMIFDYKKLFMGTKFAIFNYATKSIGGFIDVDYFKYKRIPQ